MDWLTEAACKDSRNFAGYEDTLKSGEPLKAAAGAKKPAAKPVRRRDAATPLLFACWATRIAAACAAARRGPGATGLAQAARAAGRLFRPTENRNPA
jgi:hypothetical protein